MKILLIGPNPPPHGGISVHVSGICRQLIAEGATCRVLDTSRVRPGFGFGLRVLWYALQGWTLHFHTNGHNVKSWVVALGCGAAGQLRGGSILTLHSGMVPAYLESSPAWRRKMAALTCALYTHVICVSPEIQSALLSLGVEAQAMEVLPAFLSAQSSRDSAESGLMAWMERRRPVFSTVLFFRPEYGFDVLVAALARLVSIYPGAGCVVMGSGEQRAEAEKLVREAGLEGSVLLVGDIAHEDCLALISASDVFLRPTLEDGDSISVREALAMGVPVVASRVGTRPAGAILFRAGDAEDMVAKIELAMEAKVMEPQRAGSMERLLEIYRHVDGSEGSLCLN